MKEEYYSLEELLFSGEVHSLTDIMNFSEKRDLLQRALNEYDAYRAVVVAAKLEKIEGNYVIGIRVLDERRKEIARYASYNNDEGYILKIADGFERASISIGLREAFILEVLHNQEEMKKQAEEHPIRFAMRYIGELNLYFQDILKIVTLIPHLPAVWGALRQARERQEYSE